MFTPKSTFSGFSVSNEAAAKEFYTKVVGLSITELPGMGFHLVLSGGNRVFIYEKADHQPATFTVLNFEVDSIDDAVEVLAAQGATFEHYEGMHQDEKQIMRGLSVGRGPDIAWFKDPAGNILSVLQDS